MKIKNRVCPNFTKGLDDKLKVQTLMGELSPRDILILRGLYEGYYRKPLVPSEVDVSNLTEEDIAEYSKKLATFRKEHVKKADMQQQKVAMMKHSSVPITKALSVLNERYRGATKIRRINMIADIFHNCLEQLKKDYNLEGVSNIDIINTYFGTPDKLFLVDPSLHVDLQKRTIQMALYKKMLDVQELLQKTVNENEKERLNYVLNEYKELLTNRELFKALCLFALPQIKENDGIKCSLDFSYASETDFSESAFAELENVVMEETKKDGWMVHSDEMSSYQGMQRSVKGALKFIPKYKYSENGVLILDENNKPIRDVDDMGYPINEEPLLLHRMLLDITSEIDTEESLLTALKNLSSEVPAFNHLYNRLKSNPKLLSTFRQEYFKTHLKYRFSEKNKKGGFLTVKALSGNILNKSTVFSNWISNLEKAKGILSTSIFTIKNIGEDYGEGVKGKDVVYFDNDKTKEFVKFIEEWFIPKEGDVFQNTKFKSAKIGDRKEVILKTLEYLNIPISPDNLKRVFSSTKTVNIIARELRKLVEQGQLTSNIKPGVSAVSIITTTTGEGEFTFLKDSINNIVYSVDLCKPRKLEQKVRWLDKTLFNHILPSTLSNIIDSLKRYISNPKQLREYIENNYLISSQFKGNLTGKEQIYNRLLSDLYQDPTLVSVVDSMLEKLEISRSLGSKDKDFTEFTSDEHLEVLLSEFFDTYRTGNVIYITQQEYDKKKASNSLISTVNYYIEGTPYYYRGKGSKKLPRTTYANYSTFIQGDANQLKMVRQPIYSYDECIDGLYRIALSEIAYHKQKIAFNKQLDEQGIDQKVKIGKPFGYLSFLNDIPELQNIENVQITTEVEEIIVKAIKEFIEGKKDEEGNIIKEGEIQQLKARLKASGTTNAFLEMAKKSYPRINDNDILDRALSDFAANYALSLACVQQISTISASLFDGSKDFAKRNKGTHSNGKQLNTESYNPYTKKKMKDSDAHQKVMIGNEVALDLNKIDPKFVKYVEDTLGKEAAAPYIEKLIKSTDGQGYRIIDSYYKITVMSGEEIDSNITEWYTKYKELQKKCRADNRTTFNKEEIAELEAIGYVPQPKKPITQAINQMALNDYDTMLLAQQHKYAEIILIPEMLPADSPLKAIAEAMQATDENALAEGETNFDLFLFDTGVKVGAYGGVEVYDNGRGGQLTAAEVKENIINQSKKRNGLHRVALKYTKIQTNTPEHVYDSRGFGTQLRKAVLQGINKAKNYSNYLKGFKDKGIKTIKLTKTQNIKVDTCNGHDITRLYNGIITANYVEDFRKVQELLKDRKGLSDSLIQQTIIGAKGNYNDILAYSIDPTTGEFFAPLFDAVRSHDAAANFLSTYKKIVNKQRILGGSAVQAAAFGITEKQEDESLKYIYEDGRVVGAECEMAWDIRITNADGTETELQFDDWCDENGNLKKDEEGNILLDKYYPNARKLIAYRIPTEDLYSVMNLTIVRFTRKTATGGVIKVPPQGVTQAGFDFDIDKLYFIRYEYKQVKQDVKPYDVWAAYYAENPDIQTALMQAQLLDKSKGNEVKDLHEYWDYSDVTRGIDKQEAYNSQLAKLSNKYEEWDPTKTIVENTRTARNNMLFDIIWKRMEDPETAKMRLTPGGFEKARAAAKFIKQILFNKKYYSEHKVSVDTIRKQAKDSPDPEPDYSVISVNTLLRYNEMNQIADKLIGVFANHNSNAMMASLMHDLHLGSRLNIKFGSLLKNNVKLLKRGEPVDNIGNELLADTIVVTNEDGTVNTYNIQSNVHELIAAAVDAVKDPVLNFLGLNTTTATAGALLARLGYTSEDVGLLFNQPVVKEILKKVNEGISVNAAITMVEDSLSNKGKILPSSLKLTEEVLVDQLTKEDALSTDPSTQLAVLNIISTVLDAASKVNNFVGITKNTAANSVGSSFSQMYYTQHKFEKMMSTFEGGKDADLVAIPTDDERYKVPITNDLDLTTIVDDEDYLDSIIESPFAYEQAAFDCNKAFTKSVSNIFPYETNNYKGVRAAGYAMSLYDNMSVETIDELHNDILMFALSSRGSSKFDPHNKVNGVPMIEYCLNNFPSMLYEMLNPYDSTSVEYNKMLSKYPLFDYIDVVMDEKGNYEIHVLGYKDGTKDFKYELSAYFEEVFFSEDKNVSTIGLLLVMYHYFKTGFSYNKTSFADMISPLVMSSIIANNEGESYFDVLNLVLNDLIDIPPQTMITKFVQNHPENKDFVYMPVGKRLANIHEILKKNQSVKQADNGENILTSTITVKEAVDNGLANIVYNPDGSKAIVPVKFANINESLWSFQSDKMSLPENTTTITFVKLPILGDGKYKKVYTSERFLVLNDDKDHTKNEEEPSEFESFVPEYVDSKYEEYNVSVSAIRSTYLKALMTIQGVELAEALSGDYYKGFDKKELIERLTNIFNEYKTPIMLMDENGELVELC